MSTLRVWEIETGKEVLDLDNVLGWVSAVFTPENRVLVLHSDKRFRSWSLATRQARMLTALNQVARLENAKNIQPRAVSPNGKLLALSFDGAAGKSHGHMVVELASGRVVLRTLPAPRIAVSCKFSADGKRFFTLERRPTVFHVWNVPEGTPVRSLQVPGGSSTALALRQGGRQVGTGFYDGPTYRVGFWDVDSEQLALQVEMTLPQDGRKGLSGDGRWFFLGNEKSGLARFFSLDTKKEVLCVEVPGSTTACFSPDERYAAVVGQGGLYLVRLPTP